MERRVDLDAEGFLKARQGRGTTNVDFNAGMRAALAHVRDNDTVKLAVPSWVEPSRKVTVPDTGPAFGFAVTVAV